MFDILYTLKPEVIADMIQNARKKRGIIQNDDKRQMVEIHKNYWNEISALVNIKGKYLS